MEQMSEFHVGQKVKIDAQVKSDYAGFQGIIIFVAKNMCDVKVMQKRQGSVQTHIDAFPKTDLHPIT
jgi:RNase P/RNase MRP subunit p29